MAEFDNQPVAVVGMACRMPGADGLDAFWQLLYEGRCMEAEIPQERFNRRLYFDPNKGVLCKSYASIACLMDYSTVDPSRCPLTEDDIATSDISHLTMCDVAVQACQHAGYDPWDMPHRNAGVYIGHVKGSELGGEICFGNQIDHVADYLRHIEENDQLLGGKTEQVIRELTEGVRRDRNEQLSRQNLNLGAHRGAGLVSKMLQLDGPYMVVNAACASSLQSLAIGARALQLGQIDMAIVGGASYCKFDSLVLFSRAQSVSATGTRPFDENADGLVNGEGYIAFIVKTLQRAQSDGDKIYAVVRGIGMSTDGRGKSLWAPRKEGQIEAIQRAYGHDLDMARLQFIEAHATSTQVGDQTELASLAETLQGNLPPETKIPIGSVKGNVGHTIETAGAAGLLKTILSMQHGIVPPTPNVKMLNSKIDWENSPFFVPLEPIDWPAPQDGHPRRAAVNSFGIGGLNVHIVLDDGAPPASETTHTRNQAGIQNATPRPVEPIAVVGMGAVLPGGRTIEAFWDLLHNGTQAITGLPPDRWNADVARASSRLLSEHSNFLGGFVTDFEYDWMKHRVPPKQVASADPLQFMMLDAVDQAMTLSGYGEKEFDRMSTGVCVGAVSSGEYHELLQMGLRLPEVEERLAGILASHGVPDDKMQQVLEQYRKVFIDHMPPIVDETGSYTTNTLVSRITKAYDLMGGGTAVDSGNSSGISALTICFNILQAGDCDMMICAAGHRAMGMLAFETQASKNLLPAGQPFHPLDARADGFVPGEGAAVVILKRLTDAQRDGDRIHLILRGFGASRTASLRESVGNAIDRAHQQAQIRPGQVALVETAARGVPAIDQQEVQAIADGYGVSDRQQPLPVGASAGQIGHTGGTAGMVSLLKVARSLDDVQTMPDVSLNQPADFVAEHEHVIQAAGGAIPLAVDSGDGTLLAGINATSDDQLAYHLIVERGSKVVRPAEASAEAADDVFRLMGDFRIMRTSAVSMRDLVNNVTAMSESPESAFASAHQSNFRPGDPLRVAIVVQDPQELQQRSRLAASTIGKPEARVAREEKGIFFHELNANAAAKPPRVVFLFPGHGSQYAGMLESLVEQFPPAGEVMGQIDRILDGLGYHRFSTVAWDRPDTLGTDVWQTQLALLVADTIVLASLKSLGVEPDCVSGHSYGEFPALVAAGAWSFEAAARATRARCDAIESSPEAKGIMLSVADEPSVVERLGADFQGRLHISVHNAVDQIVISGEEAVVLAMAERLKAEDIVTRVLAAPRPFHTPLMEQTKAPLAKALAEIELVPPAIPILSSVTNRYVAEPDEIRNNLVSQMTQPVHYHELIERLAEEGTDLFVEVGPHQILTKLHRRILVGRDVTCVGSDMPKRSGLRQLLHVRACLEVAGAINRLSNTDVAAIFEKPLATSDSPTDHHVAGRRSSGIPQSPGIPKSRLRIPADAGHQLATVAGLPLIQMSGSPYEMGFAHGQSQTRQIHTILRRHADLAGMKWHRIPDISKSAAESDVFFGPEDMEELRGIADGAGVAVENIVAHNLHLYPDMGAGCSHFALSRRANSAAGLLHGANEDLPLSLSLRDCLTRTVQIRRPAGGVAHLAFGVSGQLAAINGINAHGIAVTSAMLLDLPRRRETLHGRAHSALVRAILHKADDIDTAVQITRELCGAGGWSLCISHHPSDQIRYLEYDGNSLKIQDDQPRFAGTNHTQLHDAVAKSPAHSQHRLTRLQKLVGDQSSGNTSVQLAQTTLRDRFDVSRDRETPHPTMNTIRRIDNQISILMQPEEGNVWVAGTGVTDSTSGDVDKFYPLKIDQLLGGQTAGVASAPVPQAKDAPGPSSNLVLTGPDAQQALEDYGIGPRGGGDHVCHRYAVRLVETPVPETGVLDLAGHVLILGQNRVADAIRQRLTECGASAHLLPVEGDVERVIARLEQTFESAPAPHLLLVTPHDDDAVTSTDENGWKRRRKRGASLPFFVCQRWCQLLVAAKLIDQASVLAVTALGGDFGLSGNIRGIESGALSGLVKSMKIELGMKTKGKFVAKIVDFAPDDSPRRISEAVLGEFARCDGEPEVGYSGGRRFVVRPVASPLAHLTSPDDVPRGSTWVITGGARGVTAVVARQLAQRFGVKLHLVGSSPLPGIDPSWRNLSEDQTKSLRATVMKQAVAERKVPAGAWSQVEKAIEMDRNLKALDDDGAHYTYHACDVSDRVALGKVLDAIRTADGPIQGIIHGAGFESALRFEKKKPELVERTITVKVDGAANMMELTRRDPLKWFLAFGSVSGRFGGLGQTDYGLANDMLSKLVGWFRSQRPECKSTTFHWHAWDEVGMAVRPESRHLREVGGITYMPTMEGTTHLVDEIRAGVPEPEVLITGWPFHKLNPEYASKVAGASQVPAKPRNSSAKTSDESPAQLHDLPLVDAVPELIENRSVLAEIRLDPTADPFLTQHLMKGRPILPAVISMAAVAQAATVLGNGHGRVTGLENIELLEPLRFYTDRLTTARVRGRIAGQSISCELSSDFFTRSGKLVQADRPYMRANVLLSQRPVPLSTKHPSPPKDPFPQFNYPENVVLYHGEVFRALRAIEVYDDHAWSRIVALDTRDLSGPRNGDTWIVPSSAIDAAFYTCGVHVRETLPGIAKIPKSIDRMSLGRFPRTGEQLLALATCREMSESHAVYDFTIFGDDGTAIVQVEGYHGVFIPRGRD